MTGVVLRTLEPMTMTENDPLKPWVRRAMHNRTVAYTAAEACGYREDWQELACDFEKGHGTVFSDNGAPLLFGGHNSTGMSPSHLDAVTRVERHRNGTSPLSRPKISGENDA